MVGLQCIAGILVRHSSSHGKNADLACTGTYHTTHSLPPCTGTLTMSGSSRRPSARPASIPSPTARSPLTSTPRCSGGAEGCCCCCAGFGALGKAGRRQRGKAVPCLALRVPAAGSALASPALGSLPAGAKPTTSTTSRRTCASSTPSCQRCAGGDWSGLVGGAPAVRAGRVPTHAICPVLCVACLV